LSAPERLMTLPAPDTTTAPDELAVPPGPMLFDQLLPTVHGPPFGFVQVTVIGGSPWHARLVRRLP
jgi:hypothetical protein